MGLAERWLTWRLKRRDEGAARELVTRYHAGVYAYFRHLGADAETAEDLTQETYARVWQRIDTLARPDSLRSWLYTIARNEYLQWVRRGPKSREVPESSLGGRPREDRALRGRASVDGSAREAAVLVEGGPELDPLEALATTDEAVRLRRSVERLEPDLREVVALHYFRELSLRESAAVLGISPGTVKSRLHRALDRLRTTLPKEESHVAPGSRTTA